MHHDNNAYDEICEKLSSKDYKLTPQRRIVLKVFLEHMHKHLSAEDVYSIVKVKNPEIGLATIYRTLELFAELDILQKMNFGDGRSRYEFAEDEIHHHHHLICTKCGHVTEFEDDLLESLEAHIQKKSNFKIMDHQVKFYGICEKCQ
jgi:Fur family transcriptional regulator, ferric uptake regulator